MKNLFKKKHIIVLSLFALSILALCFFILAKHKDVGDSFYKIKRGMSKPEVIKILGKPHNVDNDYVWVYCYPSQQLKKWLEMTIFCNGWFIIFDENGKLLTPLFKSSEISPWDAYDECKGNPIMKSKIVGECPVFNKSKFAH